MLRKLEMISGIPALIVIVILALAGTFLAQISIVRKVAWALVAVVAAVAAWNEIKR